MMNRTMRLLGAAMLLSGVSTPVMADVAPLIETKWGQDGAWQDALPDDENGDRTYAGCTTIAAAQILYYYQYQDTASSAVRYMLDHDVTGPDIQDGELSLDLPATTHDWSAMALTDSESRARTDATATFIYHVAATLNAQFGDPSGSPATGRQVENAFRYQWGYNNIPRREMSIISKDAFQFSDTEWAGLIYQELDAGRPVLYMAQQVNGDAGHAFVIDGYRDDGMVHVNWGWGGYADGYYDVNSLTDHRGRSWSREPMIFRGLEPTKNHIPVALTSYRWTGTGSLISKSTGTLTGYGLTRDEATFDSSQGAPAVFFQWEVDPSDGDALLITADDNAGETVDIVYGLWSDRSQDRIHRNVTLPFVLDPAADGHTDLSGEYFVVSVLMDQADGGGIVSAETTSQSNSATSLPATPIQIDNHIWHGNASVISYTSGNLSGYGMTQDETRIHPGSTPVVFFQWEIDQADGRTLEISAESSRKATISYGPWNGDRTDDITRTVTLPYTISPSSDGLSDTDGEYYVIRVAFDAAPESTETVQAVAR